MPLPLRQFELRSIIASGGMGTVYRAFDLTLHRMVAVKMLKKEVAGDHEVLAGFYREARAGAALNHTNIIHTYTFDEFEGQPYLVMELADSDSLDKWIEREGRLPELAVLDIGVKVASALDTALKHNLLHRDIKPANILFNEAKEPKLVDFGLARVAEEEQAEYESTIWGTPYYVAPEKIRRETEDFKSDMYSLGGTLYHALTGRVPFDAPTIGAALRLLTGYVTVLWITFVLFVLYFFRDPDPIAPSESNAIVAPGHGTVDVIDETTESEVMGGPCKRISIFLSVFDVHVQNAPVHGKVTYLQHKPGLFVNAMRSDSAQHNENVLMGFEPVSRPMDKVGVRLIAGLIARRIVPWIKAGEVIARSERISLIQFGSRVELYLPGSTEIKVKLRDKVVGGQTIVATFR